jgi:hypothetical protein
MIIPEGTSEVQVKGFTSEKWQRYMKRIIIFKKPSKKRKLENKGQAVIQRGKMNAKL